MRQELPRGGNGRARTGWKPSETGHCFAEKQDISTLLRQPMIRYLATLTEPCIIRPAGMPGESEFSHEYPYSFIRVPAQTRVRPNSVEAPCPNKRVEESTCIASWRSDFRASRSRIAVHSCVQQASRRSFAACSPLEPRAGLPSVPMSKIVYFLGHGFSPEAAPK